MCCFKSHCLFTVIEGRSEKSIVDAKRRLEMIVWSNRLRERVTHFISIPLNHPALMDKLKLFQEEVMSKCSKVKLFLKQSKICSTFWLSTTSV